MLREASRGICNPLSVRPMSALRQNLPLLCRKRTFKNVQNRVDKGFGLWKAHGPRPSRSRTNLDCGLTLLSVMAILRQPRGLPTPISLAKKQFSTVQAISERFRAHRAEG